MNFFFKRVISLKYFDKHGAAGQITTLMVLLLVIMLVFILATVNIGDVAQKATVIDNAVDSAALQLASSLAQKSQGIYNALGNKLEDCEKRGYLDIIIAAIVAIVILVATWGAGWEASYVILACAIGGAVGGAVGAAIQGTSIAQGAITGFGVGAAIGSIGVGIEGYLAGEVAIAEGVAGAGIPTTTTYGLGTAALGALGVASSVYNSVQSYGGVAAAFSTIARELNKLPEKYRYRESAYLTAMSQAVDDPNKMIDRYDLNYNGDTSEKITSQLMDCWHQRVDQLSVISDQITALLKAFRPTLQDYADQLWAVYGLEPTCVDDGTGTGTMVCSYDGELVKLEYGWANRNTTKSTEERLVSGVADSWLIGSLRLLKSLGYPTGSYKGYQFFEVGPTRDVLWTNYFNVPCSSSATCAAPPAGYDYLDLWGDELDNMVVLIDSIADDEAVFLESWENWIELLVNFEETSSGTMYDTIVRELDEMQTLHGFIYSSSESPKSLGGPNGYVILCSYRYDAASAQFKATNAPCRFGLDDDPNPSVDLTEWPEECPECPDPPPEPPPDPPCDPNDCDAAFCPDGVTRPGERPGIPCSGPEKGGTLDADLYWSGGGVENDFKELRKEIGNVRVILLAFKAALESFKSQMMSITTPSSCSASCGTGTLTGVSSATYTWTDTAGGRTNQHTVAATNPGSFKIPRVKTTSSWSKVCNKLINDNGTVSIRVERQDPTNTSVGSLGSWNPWSGRIIRTGSARWRYDYVEQS